MALQSSGQIKLSEIAAEFGGSAPHALSEYYAGGSNVPSGTGSIPTSGQIRLATNFYGTSNVVVLHSSTITPGTALQKSGQVVYEGYDSTGGISGSNIGSISTTAISGTSVTVTQVIDRDDTASPPSIFFDFRFSNSSFYNSWSKVIINGTLTLSKGDPGGQSISSNTGYRWNASSNSQYPTPTSFQIIQ